jgi:hypothetical protein
MRFKFNTNILLISFIFSIFFTVLAINYFKFNLSPYVVRGLKFEVNSWVIPYNFSPSKSSNVEFFNYVLSKTRIPEVTFDQLFYQYSSELQECYELKSSQFIKNPFASNRISFNYNDNFSTLIIQIRHTDPDISSLCLNKISNLIESIYVNNINFSKKLFFNLEILKDQHKSNFLKQLKLNGISNFEYGKIMNLDDRQLEFLFDQNNIKSKKIIEQSKLSFDKMNSFNLYYKESTEILEYLNSINLASNFYSVRSANFSIFRILQIFLTLLFLNYVLFFIVKNTLFVRNF